MKVYKFISPYTSNEKTTFPESKNRSGVYIIKKDNKIVYVGRSGYNLYKTMYRHFQTWNHGKQEVVSYKHLLKKNKFTVRIVFCTEKQSVDLEKALILKHKPIDNTVKYNLFSADVYTKKTLEVYENTEVEYVCPF